MAEPFLTAKIETSACQPGNSTNIVVKLEQKIPFEGKATIRLIGLPEKASVPDKEITCKDTEVVFPLKVDPTCPTGSHKNLFCTAAVKKDGEVIPAGKCDGFNSDLGNRSQIKARNLASENKLPGSIRNPSAKR